MNVKTILQNVSFNLNIFIFKSIEKLLSSLHEQWPRRGRYIYSLNWKSPEMRTSQIWFLGSSWQMFLMALLPTVAEKTALSHRLSFSSHRKQGEWLLDSGCWSRGRGCFPWAAGTLVFSCGSCSLLLRRLETRLVGWVSSRWGAGQSVTLWAWLPWATGAERTLVFHPAVCSHPF